MLIENNGLRIHQLKNPSNPRRSSIRNDPLNRRLAKRKSNPNKSPFSPQHATPKPKQAKTSIFDRGCQTATNKNNKTKSHLIATQNLMKSNNTHKYSFSEIVFGTLASQEQSDHHQQDLIQSKKNQSILNKDDNKSGNEGQNKQKEDAKNPEILSPPPPISPIIIDLPTSYFKSKFSKIQYFKLKKLTVLILLHLLLKFSGFCFFMLVTSDHIPLLNYFDKPENIKLAPLLIFLSIICCFQFLKFFIKQTQNSMLDMATIQYERMYSELTFNKIANMDLGFLEILEKEKLTERSFFLVGEVSKQSILISEAVEQLFDKAALLLYIGIHTEFLPLLLIYLVVSFTFAATECCFQRFLLEESQFLKIQEKNRILEIFSQDSWEVQMANMKSFITLEYLKVTQSMMVHENSLKLKFCKVIKSSKFLIIFAFFYLFDNIKPRKIESLHRFMIFVFFLKTQYSSFKIIKLFKNYKNYSKIKKFITEIPDCQKTSTNINQNQKDDNLQEARFDINIQNKRSDQYLEHSNEDNYQIFNFKGVHFCQYSELYSHIFLNKTLIDSFRNNFVFQEVLTIDELEYLGKKRAQLEIEEELSRNIGSRSNAKLSHLNSCQNSMRNSDIDEVLSQSRSMNRSFNMETTKRHRNPSNKESAILDFPLAIFNQSPQIRTRKMPAISNLAKKRDNSAKSPSRNKKKQYQLYLKKIKFGELKKNSKYSSQNISKNSKSIKNQFPLNHNFVSHKRKRHSSYKDQFLKNMKNEEKRHELKNLMKYTEKELSMVELYKNPKIRITNVNIDFKIKCGDKLCLVSEDQSNLEEFIYGLIGELFNPDSNHLHFIEKSRVSYCDLKQDLFVHNLGIRGNILMGEIYYKFKYESVLELLGLQYLLEKNTDFNIVGENGSFLTDTERYLVKLARFLYAEKEINILMNIELENSKIKSIDLFKKILNYQLESGAILYCSNDIKLIEESSKILFFHKGQITWKGNYSNIRECSKKFGSHKYQSDQLEFTTLDYIPRTHEEVKNCLEPKSQKEKMKNEVSKDLLQSVIKRSELKSMGTVILEE